MKVNEYSPQALAFIGDAHYNMVVKRYVIDKEVKSFAMQKLAAKYCSAKGQANIISYLLDNNLLSQEEIEIYKKGRNTKTHAAPKNTDPITYKMSTGFEALWGYWYLCENETKMRQIWDIIETIEV